MTLTVRAEGGGIVGSASLATAATAEAEGTGKGAADGTAAGGAGVAVAEAETDEEADGDSGRLGPSRTPARRGHTTPMTKPTLAMIATLFHGGRSCAGPGTCTVITILCSLRCAPPA
jgi:hypothetical protein